MKEKTLKFAKPNLFELCEAAQALEKKFGKNALDINDAIAELLKQAKNNKERAQILATFVNYVSFLFTMALGYGNSDTKGGLYKEITRNIQYRLDEIKAAGE